MILNKVQTLFNESRFLEIFTPEELKDLYTESNISISELKVVLEGFLKKEIADNHVYKYLDGSVGDIKARNFIGKFLREKIV